MNRAMLKIRRRERLDVMGLKFIKKSLYYYFGK